ncbi:hypothetical protein ACX80U_03750 [Arthrobacter sp. TmT3-37]
MFQQNKALFLPTRDALLPDARALAGQVLDEQQVPELFRSMVEGKLTHVIAYDTAVAVIRGEQPPTLAEMPKAVRLLRRPSAAEIGRSIAHAQPVEMFGAQFWGEGFGLPTGVADNYGVGLPFARVIATMIQELLPVLPAMSTADATRFLTQEIKTILYTTPFMENLRVTVARELRLPVPSNSGDVRPGRLDLTAMYGVIPSIVIELDSTNKASSLGKLQYARDRGAYPIWVRWNATKGASLGSPGVITVSPAGVHGHLIGEEPPSSTEVTH